MGHLTSVASIFIIPFFAILLLFSKSDSKNNSYKYFYLGEVLAFIDLFFYLTFFFEDFNTIKAIFLYYTFYFTALLIVLLSVFETYWIIFYKRVLPHLYVIIYFFVVEFIINYKSYYVTKSHSFSIPEFAFDISSILYGYFYAKEILDIKFNYNITVSNFIPKLCNHISEIITYVLYYGVNRVDRALIALHIREDIAMHSKLLNNCESFDKNCISGDELFDYRKNKVISSFIFVKSGFFTIYNIISAFYFIFILLSNRLWNIEYDLIDLRIKKLPFIFKIFTDLVSLISSNTTPRLILFFVYVIKAIIGIAYSLFWFLLTYTAYLYMYKKIMNNRYILEENSNLIKNFSLGAINNYVVPNLYIISQVYLLVFKLCSSFEYYHLYNILRIKSNNTSSLLIYGSFTIYFYYGFTNFKRLQTIEMTD